MDISVVFATSRRQEILRKTLSSFCEMESDGLQWEILLVDNADEQETKTIVEEFSQKLPLSYLVELRVGKSFALNTAIPKVMGQVCLITDDDIIADRQWLVNTWNGVQRWPNHFLFGGKILPQYPQGLISVDVEHRLVRGAYTVADWNKEEGECKATLIYGPNTIVRSEVFHRGFLFNTDIGPNTKDYIMGQDTEFVFRLEAAGYPAVYLPDSIVHHQIRPEQLTLPWLYKRVYKSGRSFAYLSGLPQVPTLFGVPRYMYKMLLSAYFGYLGSWFSSKKVRYSKKLEYLYRKGMFYQYQKGVPKERILTY
ncbi:MAG: hypothetical protein NPIRA05_05340 [Nitrospirales bacterium]|nr:MAG: hypothetical protein NPIRA05_05340 [Nitrospirales bacterium]